MPSSSTSTFSEPDDFEAALCRQADVDLLVTGQGRFRARLTQVALHRLNLVAANETGSRIAFISTRPNLALVCWALERHRSQIWCGTPSSADEVVTLGPGARLHMRTQGGCRWAGLWISTAVLDRYWRAITRTPVMRLNGASSWRPRNGPLRTLRTLHAAAISVFEHRAGEALTTSAVDGLEQQLIHALIECLSDGVPGVQSNTTRQRHDRLMARFEDACMSEQHRLPGLKELCMTLGVPERSLRNCCKRHLGMSPMSYLRLRRMKLVRHALHSARPSDSGVAEIIRRHGFTEPGRFSARYRQLFGELPSATLKRSIDLNDAVLP
jgi:AraC-like DNA-binding protein